MCKGTKTLLPDAKSAARSGRTQHELLGPKIGHMWPKKRPKSYTRKQARCEGRLQPGAEAAMAAMAAILMAASIP